MVMQLIERKPKIVDDRSLKSQLRGGVVWAFMAFCIVRFLFIVAVSVLAVLAGMGKLVPISNWIYKLNKDSTVQQVGGAKLMGGFLFFIYAFSAFRLLIDIWGFVCTKWLKRNFIIIFLVFDRLFNFITVVLFAVIVYVMFDSRLSAAGGSVSRAVQGAAYRIARANPNTTADLLIEMQEDLNCCGFNGPMDWRNDNSTTTLKLFSGETTTMQLSTEWAVQCATETDRLCLAPPSCCIKESDTKICSIAQETTIEKVLEKVNISSVDELNKLNPRDWHVLMKGKKFGHLDLIKSDGCFAAITHEIHIWSLCGLVISFLLILIDMCVLVTSVLVCVRIDDYQVYFIEKKQKNLV